MCPHPQPHSRCSPDFTDRGLTSLEPGPLPGSRLVFLGTGPGARMGAEALAPGEGGRHFSDAVISSSVGKWALRPESARNAPPGYRQGYGACVQWTGRAPGRWWGGGEAGSREGSGSAGVAGSRTRSELTGGRRRVGLPKAGEAESSGTMGPACGPRLGSSWTYRR